MKKKEMLEIESLINELRVRPYCSVSEPMGMPNVPDGYSLPADVKRFYELAGGVTIRKKVNDADPTRILMPNEFEPVCIAIYGEVFEDGPWANWYVLADVNDGNYVSIDLHSDHHGLCYDSFHETFAMPGQVQIVATSFTDFLKRVLRHPDDTPYWLQDDFKKLGEAFEQYDYE
ncbi:MAG: SMI1/KNR4 family protein [Planctomycetota bacterium]